MCFITIPLEAQGKQKGERGMREKREERKRQAFRCFCVPFSFSCLLSLSLVFGLRLFCSNSWVWEVRERRALKHHTVGERREREKEESRERNSRTENVTRAGKRGKREKSNCVTHRPLLFSLSCVSCVLCTAGGFEPKAGCSSRSFRDTTFRRNSPTDSIGSSACVTSHSQAKRGEVFVSCCPRKKITTLSHTLRGLLANSQKPFPSIHMITEH